MNIMKILDGENQQKLSVTYALRWNHYWSNDMNLLKMLNGVTKLMMKSFLKLMMTLTCLAPQNQNLLVNLGRFIAQQKDVQSNHRDKRGTNQAAHVQAKKM